MGQYTIQYTGLSKVKILFIICLTLSFAKYSQGNNDDEEELVGDDGEDDLNISVSNNNAGNLMKYIFL